MVPVPIYKREFWRQYLIDLRRLHKDKRARRGFILRTLAVVFLLANLAYYISILYFLHDQDTNIAVAVVPVATLVIMGYVTWSQHREKRRQDALDISSAPKESVEHLQRIAHGLAAITERALGELWAKEKVLPEGFSVRAREISLESLRTHGVWNDMPSEVRYAMMQPDGAWSVGLTANVLSCGEALHSLLWCLALIQELRPLDLVLKPLPFDVLSKALVKPAPGIRSTWDIRLERNRAYDYFGRCYAEKIHREEIEPVNEVQRVAVENWIEEIESGNQSDLLAGASTVGELDLSSLYQAGRSSALRLQILGLVMDILDGKDKWPEITEVAYGSLKTVNPAVAEA